MTIIMKMRHKLDANFKKFPLLTELFDCFMLGGI